MTRNDAGTYLLAAGLALAAAAATLAPFVLVGLVGLVLAPASLVVLTAACACLRGVGATRAQAAVGFVLFVVGILALGYTMGYSSWLGYTTLRHQTHGSVPAPTEADWAGLVVCSLISAGAIVAALLLRARLSLGRAALWGAAVLAVGPASLALFFIAARYWPIGT